jgi:hypothetical protein
MEELKEPVKNSELHINAQNCPEGCYEELEKLKKNINTPILNLSIKVFTDEMTDRQKNLWI